MTRLLKLELVFDAGGNGARERGFADAARGSRRSRVPRSPFRRGAVVTIWTVLSLPILMTMLFIVAEVARLWQARTQLENAVEAAVLAAVQEWGLRGGGRENLDAAMAAGRSLAEANAVQGAMVRLGDRTKVPRVIWAFGSALPGENGCRFTPDPDAKARFAVILQVAVRTPRLCRSLAGARLGEATVTATSAAFFDPGETPPRPRLIRLAANR
jgi:Flp pilus assembly protein TadG